MQKMQPSFASMAVFTASPPTLDRSPRRLLLAAVPDRGGVIVRTIIDCQTIHVHDLRAAETNFRVPVE